MKIRANICTLSLFVTCILTVHLHAGEQQQELLEIDAQVTKIKEIEQRGSLTRENLEKLNQDKLDTAYSIHQLKGGKMIFIAH